MHSCTHLSAVAHPALDNDSKAAAPNFFVVELRPGGSRHGLDKVDVEVSRRQVAQLHDVVCDTACQPDLDIGILRGDLLSRCEGYSSCHKTGNLVPSKDLMMVSE